MADIGAKELQPADVRLNAAFNFAIPGAVAKTAALGFGQGLYSYLIDQRPTAIS